MPTTNSAPAQQRAPHVVKCPCCGGAVQKPDPFKVIEFLPLGGIRRALLRTLLASFGRDVPTEVLAERVWSGVRDGGPASAVDTVKVHAFQLREILAPYQLTVTGHRGGFRLEWVSDLSPDIDIFA